MKAPICAGLAGLLLLAQPASAIDGCRSADLSGDGRVGKSDLVLYDRVLSPETARDRFDLDGSGALGPPDRQILRNYCRVLTLCPTCPADLDLDGDVDDADLSAWQSSTDRDCRADLDRDGEVDGEDQALLDLYSLEPLPLSMAAKRADLDGDGDVDGADKTLLVQRLDRDCRRDLNRDGEIGAADIQILLASWGNCPEPAVFPVPEDPCDEGSPPITLPPEQPTETSVPE